MMISDMRTVDEVEAAGAVSEIIWKHILKFQKSCVNGMNNLVF